MAHTTRGTRYAGGVARWAAGAPGERAETSFAAPYAASTTGRVVVRWDDGVIALSPNDDAGPHTMHHT